MVTDPPLQPRVYEFQQRGSNRPLLARAVVSLVPSIRLAPVFPRL